MLIDAVFRFRFRRHLVVLRRTWHRSHGRPWIPINEKTK